MKFSDYLVRLLVIVSAAIFILMVTENSNGLDSLDLAGLSCLDLFVTAGLVYAILGGGFIAEIIVDVVKKFSKQVKPDE